MHKALGVAVGFVATIAVAGSPGGGHAGGGAHGGGASHSAGGTRGATSGVERGSLIETLMAAMRPGRLPPKANPDLHRLAGLYGHPQQQTLPLCSDEQRRQHRCDDKGLITLR